LTHFKLQDPRIEIHFDFDAKPAGGWWATSTGKKANPIVLSIGCDSMSDSCPNNADKIKPTICGCGTPDTDSDMDSMPDCHNECCSDGGKTEMGQCGCSISKDDRNRDSMPD